MPVATMQLVTLFFIVIVPHGTPQLIQVIFKGSWAYITHHSVPLWHDACVLDALEMGGRAVVIGMINVEAPPTVLPQGAIPFGVVRLLITTFEAVREGSALSLPFTLVFGYGTQLKAIFALNVTPLVFWWSLCCIDTWEEG